MWLDKLDVWVKKGLLVLLATLVCTIFFISEYVIDTLSLSELFRRHYILTPLL
jgi:hypothetical protein